MFSILDVGVDGVIFQTGSIGEARNFGNLGTKSFDLKTAKITEIQELILTSLCRYTSMLHKGEEC